jgi:hypothetical protein
LPPLMLSTMVGVAVGLEVDSDPGASATGQPRTRSFGQEVALHRLRIPRGRIAPMRNGGGGPRVE